MSDSIEPAEFDCQRSELENPGVHFCLVLSAINIRCGWRAPVKIGNQCFHLGDFPLLHFNDSVCQLAYPGIGNIGTCAG